MIMKLLNFVLGRLDAKQANDTIYKLLPKLSQEQWEALGNYALRFAGTLAEKTAEGAVAGAINANKK